MKGATTVSTDIGTISPFSFDICRGNVGSFHLGFGEKTSEYSVISIVIGMLPIVEQRYFTVNLLGNILVDAQVAALSLY